MWSYEKRLQYPVNIKNPNPAAAKIIISQLGGPDGEMAASMRYLNQRYTAPCREVQGLLNDIGTEAPEMFLSGAQSVKKPLIRKRIRGKSYIQAKTGSKIIKYK